MLKNTKNLLKLLLVITIVLSSVFVLTGCGKKNKENKDEQVQAYLQPLKDYFDGIKNKDINLVLKAFPDFMNMSTKITEDDINDLYSQYESLYGANIKIEYTFGEAIALGEEELSDLENEIVATYTDLQTIDITAGYTVPVKVTVTGDGIQSTENSENADDANKNENSNTNTEDDEMYVLQYNGNWYIM